VLAFAARFDWRSEPFQHAFSVIARRFIFDNRRFTFSVQSGKQNARLDLGAGD
jgi:hypothetical protein